MLGALVGGVTLSVLFAVVARFAFTRERRIKRALAHVRPTAIAQARDGQAVKIVGELIFVGRPITSPLSRRICAFYSIVVEEFHRGFWYEVLREERGVDFHLRDPTGTALVRVAHGPSLPALVQDRRARNPDTFHSDDDLVRFLAERGRSVERTLFSETLRAREGILAAFERVAVGGVARWIPDPDAGVGSYRETAKRLVLEASEALPLLISDDPTAAR